MQDFSFEKASKFKDKDRFFDINYLTVPGLKWAVEKLYYTSIRPELVVILSLLCGVISAWFYSMGEYSFSILGIIFILLKNFLDTVDGYLARAKGLESRLGRFLDSLADAAVYICLFTGLAINLKNKGYGNAGFILSYLAMISAFLQCSVYNYYLVSYKTLLKGEVVNRTDEGFKENESWYNQKSLSDMFLFALQCVYHVIYGWQDKIVSLFDRKLFQKFRDKNEVTADEPIGNLWYADRTFLSFVSPLCFGTQIVLLSFFTLFNSIPGFLWFILIVWNCYAAAVMLWRVRA